MAPHLGILGERLQGERTGVGRYLLCLLKEWIEESLRGGFPFGRVTLYTSKPLPDDLLPFSPRFVNQVVPTRLPTVFWGQWILPRLIADVDVLFCPSDVIPLTYRGRTVVTRHDMLQVLRTADFPFSSRFRQAPLQRLSARRADRVITVAAATVPLIVEHYGVEAERIQAISLAADAGFTPAPDDHDAAVAREFGLVDLSFVLFVGKLARRRHLPELIEAFGRVADLHHRLVIVGPNPMQIPIGELARQHGVEDQVKYMGYVEDRSLRSLYRLADVFVYPSEMEGFGLPVLEAMQSGTAVITLNRPVLVEVGGEAPCYLDEATPDALAVALHGLLTDKTQRTQRVAAGLKRAKEFTWAMTARRTLVVLSSVAGVTSAARLGERSEGA